MNIIPIMLVVLMCAIPVGIGWRGIVFHLGNLFFYDNWKLVYVCKNCLMVLSKNKHPGMVIDYNDAVNCWCCGEILKRHGRYTEWQNVEERVAKRCKTTWRWVFREEKEKEEEKLQ